MKIFRSLLIFVFICILFWGGFFLFRNADVIYLKITSTPTENFLFFVGGVVCLRVAETICWFIKQKQKKKAKNSSIRKNAKNSSDKNNQKNINDVQYCRYLLRHLAK